MKSQKAWLLLASFLLVYGMTRGAEKPQPDVKAAMENAVAAQKECSQRLGLSVEITNSIGIKLKLIPPGEFLMGSQAFGPQHKVRITKPFYLGVYEVTQQQYEKVMGATPSYFSTGGGGADRVSGKDTSGNPVEAVSWRDTVEFCKRLSAREGKTYRLPTEAEWEYACRAGTTTRWSFGDDPASLGEYAWHRGNSDKKTHPVGKKKPNVWGLYDMHGNVSEWCADRYDRNYYAVSPTEDPLGPERSLNGVFRGGGWSGFPWYCRSACRSWDSPVIRYNFLGFRVAAVPSSTSRQAQAK